MKSFFTILMYILIVSTGSAQIDTVTLNLGSVTAPAGEKECLTLTAENFENIISVQLGFSWDANAASLDTIRPGRLKNIAFSNNAGTALFSWFDVIGISTISEEPLIELCFTSLSNTPTPIVITSLPNLIIEVVNNNDEFLHVKTTEDLFSPEEQPLDCEGEIPCLSGLEINYEGDTIIIWPQDLISSTVEEFLRCNNTTIDLLKLINLSSAETSPLNYIEFSCGNLRETSYVALAIQNFDSPQYWVSCIIPVRIRNISESADCINTNLYPTDPRICSDVSQDVDGNSLRLGQQQLLSLEIPPTVEHTYFNHTYGWEYSLVTEESPMFLDCGDFNQSLFLTTSMIIAPPEGPFGISQIVIPEFCTHQIDIAADSTDCNSSISDGQVKLKIDGLPEQSKLKVYLNSKELNILSDDSHVIELNSLLPEVNELSLETLETPTGVSVSTLDLIYMIKALRDEEILSPHQIIASDVDRSGSVTTKDILQLRKFILGSITEFDNGFLYLADIASKMPNLDILQFDNNYKTYLFDKQDIETSNSLDLFAGVIGDVSLDKRKKNKNLQHLELKYNNQYLHEGDIQNIILEIENPSDSHITGLLLSLSEQNLEIKNITILNNNTATLSNNLESEYRFSYINLDYQKGLKLQLELSVKRNGLLSDLLALSDYKNEGINSNNEEFQLVLTPRSQPTVRLQAYPNPTDGELVLDIPLDYEGGTLSISNVLGRTIWQEKIKENGLKMISRDILSHKGIYIMQLQKESRKQALKVYVH